MLAQALSLALVFGIIGGGLFLALKLSFQGNSSDGSADDGESALNKARDVWNKYK